jgi:hypothetical protein
MKYPANDLIMKTCNGVVSFYMFYEKNNEIKLFDYDTHNHQTKMSTEVFDLFLKGNGLGDVKYDFVKREHYQTLNKMRQYLNTNI